MAEFDIHVVPEEDLFSTSSSDIEDEDVELNPYENDSGDEELSPSTEKELSEDSPSTMVRTRCGHIFHKECLKA